MLDVLLKSLTRFLQRRAELFVDPDQGL